MEVERVLGLDPDGNKFCVLKGPADTGEC